METLCHGHPTCPYLVSILHKSKQKQSCMAFLRTKEIVKVARYTFTGRVAVVKVADLGAAPHYLFIPVVCPTLPFACHEPAPSPSSHPEP